MKLFHVEITHESFGELWVFAETEEAALADAKELSHDIDWEGVSTDYQADTFQSPHAGAQIWSGGEDGHDMTKAEADALVESVGEAS